MFGPTVTRDCWFVTGPTAAGKTAIGIELARMLEEKLGAEPLVARPLAPGSFPARGEGGNGQGEELIRAAASTVEILSLDSMSVYRGMDIGTAKPTAVERAAVPHQLIDLVEPEQEFSLADYVEAAASAVARAREEGREPVFVGGTPLYLKSLLRGIFEGPPADWEFRRRLEAEAAQRGDAWLHARVETLDPAAAAKLHPRDTRRLIRVLEVLETTGQRISGLQQQFERARPAAECRVFVIDWPREMLYQRINARVERMFAAGLVDEVRKLTADGKKLGRTASQALGYREVVEHLAGQRCLAETVQLVQNRTRQFSRRQLTWFRSLSECRWVSVSEGDSASEIAQRISNFARTAHTGEPEA